jgi:hypothetical protein
LRLRRTVAVVAASVGLVAAAPAAQAPAKTAHAACSYAKIGGKRKCIARGQYCARRYQRDYRRRGLSCSKLDYRGRYHLR